MTMTTGKAIKQGFVITRRVRSAVWILFLVNLGLAALAGLPIYHGILRFTAYSLLSQTLARGFSQDWLTDFSVNGHGSLNRYAAVIVVIGLLSIPVNSVLAGGVMARFRTPKQTSSLGDFLRDTARYAGRLLRLMIIGLVCYWIIFWLLNQWLRTSLDRWARDWLDDRPIFWLHLSVFVALFLALTFVNVVMDYARVKLILDESSSALEALLAALGFCLARLRKAATVYAVPSLCGIALLGVYRLLVPWHLVHNPFSVVLLFIGQQLIMAGRYWFRVAAWGSEWSLYSSSR